MVLDIILIRHGKTSWNIDRRYLGKTDQSLCAIGINELRDFVKNNIYMTVDTVISSSMKRCIETSRIIYPNKSIVILDDLSEIDFGKFEGKTYEDLKDDSEYIKWIDSMGKTSVGNIEPQQKFYKRTLSAFYETTTYGYKNGLNKIAIITHGGVIMNIMSRLTEQKDIFMWQCRNGGGFRIRYSYNKNKIIDFDEV